MTAGLLSREPSNESLMAPPMSPNPLLGVLFHWLGGLAAGSFYVPYRQVKHWAWEVYWLVGGFFSWIVCPWLLASLLTKDLLTVITHQGAATLWWTYFFGCLWGLGGLTFGLTMRYLGMSLGMGAALGYCAAFGTLVPPIAKSLFKNIPAQSSFGEILSSVSGQVTLAGVGVCFVGIFLAALAGLTKEREMPEAEKKKAIAEFNFTKGILVATFSGIMSACFAFGLTAGNPISEASLRAGTSSIWSGLPKLVIVLLGGFTTNFIWCVALNLKNRTGEQYFTAQLQADSPTSEQERTIESALDAFGEKVAVQATTSVAAAPLRRFPLLSNYLFSALAGITWYLQFFFYTMGETKMGKFNYVSWTLHMASIIIFSTMWGWYFHEWKGASRRAHRLIQLGLGTLILSTIVIGGGAWLKEHLGKG